MAKRTRKKNDAAEQARCAAIRGCGEALGSDALVIDRLIADGIDEQTAREALIADAGVSCRPIPATPPRAEDHDDPAHVAFIDRFNETNDAPITPAHRKIFKDWALLARDLGDECYDPFIEWAPPRWREFLVCKRGIGEAQAFDQLPVAEKLSLCVESHGLMAEYLNYVTPQPESEDGQAEPAENAPQGEGAENRNEAKPSNSQRKRGRSLTHLKPIAVKYYEAHGMSQTRRFYEGWIASIRPENSPFEEGTDYPTYDAWRNWITHP